MRYELLPRAMLWLDLQSWDSGQGLDALMPIRAVAGIGTDDRR